MEEEREEGGISLGDIFRTIFSQKWLALIIAAVITIAGTLCIYFLSNYSKREYTASFVLDLPGDDTNGGNYVYPDGNAFYYSDVVSLSTLRAVKQSDGAFDKIDVNKLSKNGAITISRTRTQLSTDNYETIYTINAKAKYFPDDDAARSFIMALANVPGQYLIEMHIDYDANIVAARDAIDYENEITYLKNQMNYLVTQYNVLIEEYKQDFVINDGKTLQNYKEEARSYINTNTLDNLITLARDKGYLKSNSLKSKYEIELSQARKDMEDAKFTLDQMVTGTSDQTQNAEAIRVQSEKYNTLKRKVEYLEKYTGNDTTDVPDSYTQALQTAYTEIEKYTSDFKQAVSTVYGNSATVSFSSSNIINTVGETGLVFSLIISLVAGLVVAAIVAYIVGRVKQNKAKTKPEVVQSAEVQAQAAATDDEQK